MPRLFEMTGTRPLKLLAVFAHPDDESFAVGDTLAKYASQGIEVVIVSPTRGEAGIPGLKAAKGAARRESELRAAAAKLGESEARPQVIVSFGSDGISGDPDHITVSHWVTAAFDALDGPGAPWQPY